jgi:putative transposase
VRYRNSQPIVGTPKNVTVSKRGDHWYVSIQTEVEIEQPRHKATSIVGGDLGIARFLTLSTGEYFEPLNSFKKLEKKLAKLQRTLARRVKGSVNWKKTRGKISRLHIRIANARNDYLHKLSHDISKNHAVVVLEELKVANMSTSAKGTVEQPGRNVKAKSGLNKSLLDQGWYEFRRQLGYKLEWLGGMLVLVNPKNTSRCCPECGHTSGENRKTQSSFVCVECGYKENADFVGALNVLRAGHAQLACGENPLGISVKQEPARIAA